MFDADSMMRNFAGHRSIAVAMIVSLVTDVPERIEALSSTLAAGDLAGAEREAHTLKGLGGNGGAPLLRDLALQVESSCRDGRLEEARRKLPDLAAEADCVIAEWRSFLVGAG